jgi:hypothetical protein
LILRAVFITALFYWLNYIMQRYRVKTLVDITKTDVLKEHTDSLGKHQQDNFNTLLHTLEMRGNISYSTYPYTDLDIWEGKTQKTWIWEFWTEQHELFESNNDPVGLLRKDLEFVPFIRGCTESVNFHKSFFAFEDNIKIEQIQ